MRLLNIGYGNSVSAARVIAVVTADSAPARRTVSFRVPEGRAVEAFGALGPVEPTHEADGSFSIRLDECSAVLLTSRPAPCVRRDERRPAARHGDMAELPLETLVSFWRQAKDSPE